MALSVAELKAIASLDSKPFKAGMGKVTSSAKSGSRQIGATMGAGLKKMAGMIGAAFAVRAVIRFGAAQMQAAAQVSRDIASQRAAVGQSLAGLGQGGLGQAIGAAGQQVTAAMTPQQLYNQYASVIFGAPAQAYSPNFAGTQGQTQTGTSYKFGIDLGTPTPKLGT